jgi:hypothetical protein
LDNLERLYGRVAVARLGSFLTCSEFGLSETELLELLMPTSNSAATLKLSSGNYNFSTLCAVRRRMSELHDSDISFLLPFSLSIDQSLFPFVPFYYWRAFIFLYRYLFVFFLLYALSYLRSFVYMNT